MRNRVPMQGGVYAIASNSQTRGVLGSRLAAKGVRISANEYQTRCMLLEKPGTANGSAQECADLGQRISNPVQADREKSQTLQTVVIAHGSAVHTQRYVGASARYHKRVMPLQGNQPDTGTMCDRWRGFLHGNRLQRCGNTYISNQRNYLIQP